MACLRDDVAVEEYEKLCEEKQELNRKLAPLMRRARELKKELTIRKQYLPPLKR